MPITTRIKHVCLILIIFSQGFYLYAQDSTLTYHTSLLLSGANGQTPFWLQSNQYGAIPTQGSFVSGQWGVHRIYNPGNPRFFQLSGGAELITNVGKSNSVFFTDLYLALKAGPVEISAGQRKERMGLSDSTLSSGSFAMSDNARPYPKIQIATPNFVNIIPSNDLFTFKFSYSDGLIGSSETNYGNIKFIPKTYLHQKSIYLRLGGLRHKLSLYAGFNHQAMWGGEEKIFAGGLKTAEAYRYVVFGKSWANSRVGNHFGTIDVAAEWRGKDWNIFFYRQSIYEDGSLSELTNIQDGLNGIRFKRAHRDKNDTSLKLNTILLEFIYTKEQGGSVFDYDKGIFGSDNYFNHYVYPRGWSYKNQALGTPLIGPQYLNRDDVPKDPKNFTVNNRIYALHLGLNASWQQTNMILKATHSRNFGTYSIPFDPSLSQSSFLLQVERPVPIWNKSVLSISLASDFGKLYPNSSAVSIGLVKSGFIK